MSKKTKKFWYTETQVLKWTFIVVSCVASKGLIVPIRPAGTPCFSALLRFTEKNPFLTPTVGVKLYRTTSTFVKSWSIEYLSAEIIRSKESVFPISFNIVLSRRPWAKSKFLMIWHFSTFENLTNSKWLTRMQFYHSVNILSDLKVTLRLVALIYDTRKNRLYLVRSDFLFDCWQVSILSWLWIPFWDRLFDWWI